MMLRPSLSLLPLPPPSHSRLQCHLWWKVSKKKGEMAYDKGDREIWPNKVSHIMLWVFFFKRASFKISQTLFAWFWVDWVRAGKVVCTRQEEEGKTATEHNNWCLSFKGASLHRHLWMHFSWHSHGRFLLPTHVLFCPYVTKKTCCLFPCFSFPLLQQRLKETNIV